MSTKILAFVILLFTVFSAEARVDPEKLKKSKTKGQIEGSRMDCQPALAQYDLEINNVRARLLAGGDFWWDFQEGRYIVPKPQPGYPEVSALYASGIWMGGVDPNGALKLAGVTYRTQNVANNATDYYSGPLDQNGQTSAETCNDWDRHFVVKGENILNHLANYKLSVENNEMYLCNSIPDDVKYWPARGNPFFEEEYDFSLPDQNLADFFDMDGDGLYNPCEGDYPVLKQRGCDDMQIPDEIVFWVFNDNGGPHVLSGATAIQMEVQAQAFAYATQDELNDMTFYRFKLINKASDDIRDCYFGLWTDPDLGCSEDDYVGCDVERSMAYIYNEDAVDGSPGPSCPGGVATYGEDIPIIGIDFFRGPRGPKVFCGFDNEGNRILCDPEPGTGDVDTIVELGMTSFTYQNRGVSNPPEGTKDPDLDFEYYNILKGLWKDGTAVTYGGSGYNPASIDSVRFVFSDPPSDANGWSMCSADLPFDDRRTIQATGPLLLQPGAINELIFGVVFAPNADYPCPEIKKLQFADDLAQSLFDNCFRIFDGPDAPDLKGIKLDQQLIFVLTNDELSNNFKLEYKEEDLLAPEGVDDPYYLFEGYKIYQLAEQNVSYQELNDIEKARIIRQVDIKNGIDDIYNWFPIANPDPTVNEFIWVPEKQVSGEDKGIQHSFSIKKDVFANGGNQNLVNGKEYFYTVVAYAHNNYMQYDVEENIGQRNSYIEGRKNVKTYAFKPRSLDEVEVPTVYGQEAPITRIEGVGTSFNALDMADGEAQSILDGSFDGMITYKAGRGPINPKVVDPLRIKDGSYRLEIVGEYDDASATNKFISPGARWDLTDISTGEVIASDRTIEEINEQIIDGRGFSIEVNQIGDPGDQFDENNGAISQEYEYEDAGASKWWNAIPAFTGIEVMGEYLFPFVDLEDDDDPDNALSMIDDGHFIPIKSARWINSNMPYITPAWKTTQGITINQGKLRLKELNNVDIVFTSDKSKWSKCIVVESAVPDFVNFPTRGEKTQFDLRSDSSIDQDGNEIDGQGMSYFPGYAIDVETGERLNIFFGENSAYSPENDESINQSLGTSINTGGIGTDMIWNPSTELFTEELPENFEIYKNIVGGQHYMYVTRQEYDECEGLRTLLESGGLLNKSTAVGFVTWTGIPIPAEPLLSLSEGLIPNDLTIKLRVTNPFNRELNSLSNGNTYEAVGGLPVYEFGFQGVEVNEVVATKEEPKQILDKIVLSPNPYYESSIYGQSHSGNLVKMNNLPKGAVVTIYSLEGKFIRQFREESGSNFIETESGQDFEWNLDDRNGVRISGGIYIFHIAVPHLGIQKSFKWIKV